MAEAVKPEARGGVAIDDQVFFEGVILLVGGDVPQMRKILQLGHEPLHPSGQLVRDRRPPGCIEIACG